MLVVGGPVFVDVVGSDGGCAAQVGGEHYGPAGGDA